MDLPSEPDGMARFMLAELRRLPGWETIPDKWLFLLAHALHPDAGARWTSHRIYEYVKLEVSGMLDAPEADCMYFAT
jgi:hypothetical protein